MTSSDPVAVLIFLILPDPHGRKTLCISDISDISDPGGDYGDPPP